MLAPDSVTQWTKYWLYDWGGANVQFFVAIQRAVPDGWVWLLEILSALGSYWGAPVVIMALLLWRRLQVRQRVTPIMLSVYRFLLGFALAMAAAVLAKTALALPRPFLVLGDAVYRAASSPDSRYTMPSGHSVYVGVLAAALWPALGWWGRTIVLVFAALVAWSRIALGAHFPADVVAGVALGWVCVAAMSPWTRRLERPMVAAGAGS